MYRALLLTMLALPMMAQTPKPTTPPPGVQTTPPKTPPPTTNPAAVGGEAAPQLSEAEVLRFRLIDSEMKRVRLEIDMAQGQMQQEQSALGVEIQKVEVAHPGWTLNPQNLALVKKPEPTPPPKPETPKK